MLGFCPTKREAKFSLKIHPFVTGDGRRWLVARLKLVAAGIGDLGLG
jgi:hypothetical protein